MEFFFIIFLFKEAVGVQCKKKKKAEDKQKLFILETHHPQIITDHILMYMITLLYIFSIFMFKTRIGSYCIYCFTSFFFFFALHQILKNSSSVLFYEVIFNG